jgi:heterodisulfide reductase subunit C
MIKNVSQIPSLGPGIPESLGTGSLNLTSCYQCKKCSSGCPLTFAMDLLPDQVVRLALLGQEELVLASTTIWVCSSCETCTTRCPNGVDIAGIMDRLKEMAFRRGSAPAQPEVAGFHQAFLTAIRLGGGRLSEPLLLGLHGLKSGETVEKIKSGKILDDLRLGWELARRGRLVPKLPRRLQGYKEIKQYLSQWEPRD